jgi:transposase
MSSNLYRLYLYHTATNTITKKVLKGTRWLLLKNFENLKEKHDELQRLQVALELNQPLVTNYYMKEELHGSWEQPGKKTAEIFLDDWITRTRVSKVTMLMRFSKVLKIHKRGILIYYDYPVSTGPFEEGPITR